MHLLSPACAILLRVELDAKSGQIGAGGGAEGGVVLADAACEDDRVNLAAQLPGRGGGKGEEVGR